MKLIIFLVITVLVLYSGCENGQLPKQVINVVSNIRDSSFQKILTEIISEFENDNIEINLVISVHFQNWDVAITDIALIDKMIADNNLKNIACIQFPNLYQNHIIYSNRSDSIIAVPVLINLVLLYSNLDLLKSINYDPQQEINEYDISNLAELIFIPDSIYGMGCINNDFVLTFAYHKMYGGIQDWVKSDFDQMINNLELNYCRSGIFETKFFVWNLFLRNRVAFVIGDNELLEKLKLADEKFNYKISPIINKPSPKVLSKNIYAMINAQSNKDSIACLFIKHLISERNLSKFYSNCTFLGFPSDSTLIEGILEKSKNNKIIELLRISQPFRKFTNY